MLKAAKMYSMELPEKMYLEDPPDRIPYGMSVRLSDGPRMYTVEDGRSLRDHWQLADSKYDLWVYGPNSFLRAFTGKRDPQESLQVQIERTKKTQYLLVSLRNSGKISAKVSPFSNAYFKKTAPLTIAAGSAEHYEWPLAQSQNWYDFTVSFNENTFERRFAGRMETGKMA